MKKLLCSIVTMALFVVMFAMPILAEDRYKVETNGNTTIFYDANWGSAALLEIENLVSLETVPNDWGYEDAILVVKKGSVIKVASGVIIRGRWEAYPVGGEIFVEEPLRSIENSSYTIQGDEGLLVTDLEAGDGAGLFLIRVKISDASAAAPATTPAPTAPSPAPAPVVAATLQTTDGLTSVIPPSPQAVDGGFAPLQYTVQPGEKLFSIAYNYYGSMSNAAVNRIYNANREYFRSTKNVLEAGAVITLPAEGLRVPITQTALNNAAGVYLVKSGDTLADLAKAYYGNANHWRKIYEANKDRVRLIGNSPMIYEGQWLVIPR